MRLGLFGGTFDPVHFGHLLLAEQCREQCGLDEVRFLPAGCPPHKSGRPLSPGRLRAELIEFAIAGHERFTVDRREIRRDGTTFTVETLEELTSETPLGEWRMPDREIFFLIGSDSLADLPTWREPERIVELATIVAVNRGDRPLPDAESLEQALGPAIAARVQRVTMPGVDLSASDIRRRVRAGRSIRYMVPRAVEMAIAEHGLYRGD